MLHTLVLAGGAGTRFWPLSTPARPKQLLALGPSSRTLLADTIARVAPLGARPWVITTSALADAVRAEAPGADVLVEPVGRGTAPAIAWATAQIAAVDADAVVIVLPADHHIADADAFRAALGRAVALAAKGALVTIGVRPTRAETGYGWLEVEGDVVRSFVEKPDRARAEAFLAGGRHLWNAGVFVFRADAALAAVAAHVPALTGVFAARWADLTTLSWDHGVMEHAADVRVVPGDFGWSDLGSFATAWELAAHDAAGNAAPGATLHDATGNYVVAPAGKEVVLIGVHDLVVVDTGDALLVVPRDRAQDVGRARR